MLSLAALLLCACAGSPPAHYYALRAAAGGNAAGAANYSVVVGPVALSEVVDRPQIVSQISAHEVQIHEQQRWAEPLRSGIARVIAENLAQLLGTPRVRIHQQAVISEADYRVAVDVPRFESAPGAGVTVEALWTVRRAAGGTTLTGRSLAQEPVDADGYDALVAAHGRALAAVSRDIADAIRAARRQPG